MSIRGQKPISEAALILSAILLGCAVHVRNGLYHPLAISLLAAALLVLPLGRWITARALDWLLPAGITLQAGLILTRAPLNDASPSLTLPFVALVAGVALIGLSFSLGKSKWLAGRIAVALVLYLAAGQWVIRQSPNPRIDVMVFQHDGCAALLRGENPYRLTFPNIYPAHADVYAPEVVKGDRLHFGYPYLPLTLLLTLPAYLAGDVRYAGLFASMLAALAMTRLRRDATGAAMAVLFLLTPRMFFVIEWGWTEPLSVMLLALATSAPKSAVGAARGLLIGSKQYFALIVPLVWREWFAALIAAAVVTLPLALWDLGAFWKSAVALQLHQPFRTDALSFAAWLNNVTGFRLPVWTPLLFVVPLLVWQLRRRTLGFAASVALLMLVFFATSKQAFCNYYFLVIGALLIAAASEEPHVHVSR